MHPSETEPRSSQPFTAPATSSAEAELVARSLADNEYIRQRLAPQPGDHDYLCLSDLLGATAASRIIARENATEFLASADLERGVGTKKGVEPTRALDAGSQAQVDVPAFEGSHASPP